MQSSLLEMEGLDSLSSDEQAIRNSNDSPIGIDDEHIIFISDDDEPTEPQPEGDPNEDIEYGSAFEKVEEYIHFLDEPNPWYPYQRTGISLERENGGTSSIRSPLQNRPGSYQLAGRRFGSRPMCW